MADERGREPPPPPARGRRRALVAGRFPHPLHRARRTLRCPDLRALDGRGGGDEPGHAARERALLAPLVAGRKLDRVHEPRRRPPRLRGRGPPLPARRGVVDRRPQDRRARRLQARPAGVRGHGLDARLRRPGDRRHGPPTYGRQLEPRLHRLERGRDRDLLLLLPGAGLGPSLELAGVGDLRRLRRLGRDPAAHEPARRGLRPRPLAGRASHRLHGRGRTPRHLPEQPHPRHEPGRLRLAAHLRGLRPAVGRLPVGPGRERPLLQRRPRRVSPTPLRLGRRRRHAVDGGEAPLLPLLVRGGWDGGGHDRHRSRAGRPVPLRPLRPRRRDPADAGERGCAARRHLGRGGGGVVRVDGRLPSAGMDRETARLRFGARVSAHARDPRRAARHVQRGLQLRLPGARRERLRRPLHEPAREHRLRDGVRERDQPRLSGGGLPGPHGGRGRDAAPRLRGRGTTCSCTAVRAAASSRRTSSATRTASGRRRRTARS